MSAVLSNRPTVPDKRCTIGPVFTRKAAAAVPGLLDVLSVEASEEFGASRGERGLVGKSGASLGDTSASAKAGSCLRVSRT